MKRLILTILYVVVAITSTAQQKHIVCVWNNGTYSRLESDSITFTDKKQDSNPTYSIPEAIDLGLSVKWASFNLGATKPEEYGNYYAWGETAPKDNYTNSNYKYYKDNNCTKYYADDNLWTLLPDDDAATFNLGSPWRMPTFEELKELIKKCTWKKTKVNGVIGFKVIGPNGNNIFIPSGGYQYEKTKFGIPYDARYWTSSLYGDSFARNLLISDAIHTDSNQYREKGLLIRPVYQ